jgi:hypothetical protein
MLKVSNGNILFAQEPYDAVGVTLLFIRLFSEIFVTFFCCGGSR